MTIKVNAMGDACPIPVVKTQKAMQELGGAGTVKTLVDNETAVQNLGKLAASKGCTSKTEKLGENEYRVTITAGEDAELPDSADGICTVPAAADNTVVAISADHMGEGGGGAVPACRSAGADDPCPLSDRGGLRSGVEGAAAGAGRALHRIGHSSRRS